MKFSFEWLKASGPLSLVVLTSRVRVARNFAGFSFPHLARREEKQKILKKVQEVVEGEHLRFFPLSSLSVLDWQVLVEGHLMSLLHAQGGDGKGLVLSQDGSVSIMVNEEDHLRIQCLLGGLRLQEARATVEKVDNLLEGHIDVAFHEEWGYLTACPTNVGTGMRASTLVHLPALVMTNMIPMILQGANQMGLAVRGLYGEGSESQGHLFQLSNSASLGQSEEEIVGKVDSATRQLVERELDTRAQVKREHFDQIADRVWRAYGILSTAHTLNSAEAMELLSLVRLGVQQEILPPMETALLNELFMMMKPGSLQASSGEEMGPFERDRLRAAFMRKKLPPPREREG